MIRIKGLAAAAAVSISTLPAAYAATYQDGKSTICTAATSCSVKFRNPGNGVRLKVNTLTCKIVTSDPANAFVTEFFDGTNALYVPTYSQDGQGRSFVAATGAVTFFTGGSQMLATALHGKSLDSQLSCTLTGVTG